MMAWPKGRERGQKTGGRKKGTPNKKSSLLHERLDDLGFDVLFELQKLLPEIAPTDRAKILLAMFEYLFPKRRPVDLVPQEKPLSLHAQIVAALAAEKNEPIIPSNEDFGESHFLPEELFIKRIVND